GRPARELRALRRRSRPDQPAGGGVRRGDPGAGAGHGGGVASAGEPHRAPAGRRRGGPAMTRPVPPAGGTPRDFVLPEAQSFTLGNGMTVTLVPWGSIPKATVSLVLRAGSLNERPDEVWLADLVGDLLQEGTLSRDAREVAVAAAGMGGSVKVATGFDQTGLTGDGLAEAAPGMVRLLAELVRHPRLPESELPRLRQDRLRELAVARQQPDQLALEAFRRALHGDHPYGRLFPAEATLAGFTIGQARGYY